VAFTCADDVSGVATCPPNTTSSGEGAAKTVSGTATDRAGNSSTITAGPYKIDLTAPTVTGAATTAPNANGWFKSDLTIRWTCTDALSGVKTCPPDTAVTGEGAALTVTSGTATDNAGNTNTGTAGPYTGDRTVPSAVITSSGYIKFGGTLKGTAADSLSGVDTVIVVYDNNTAAAKTATVSCSNADRKSCTWTASLPGFGFHSARATVKDKAGWTAQSNEAFLNVTL
jgi:hypothetical protein